MQVNKEFKFEIERDFATRFVAEQYITRGYPKHLHRNVEIYGVVKGSVDVHIGAEIRTLTPGQIAIINCLETHEYIVSLEAEIFYFHIGTAYMSMFYSQYKHGLLPRWLLEKTYNQKLYEQISRLYDSSENMSDLKRHGVVTSLLADIVDYYGISNGGDKLQSHDLVEQVIQYIYENYADEITLESLGKQFYIDPKLLSKKISRYIGVDFRTYVNDIRLQKVLQILNDPQMHHVSKKEIIRSCGFKRSATFYDALKRKRRVYQMEETGGVEERL